ncbi:hypothetical protein JCM19992_35060 [Thermostilla marina]
MNFGAILPRTVALLGLFCVLLFVAGCPRPDSASSTSQEETQTESDASQADSAAGGDASTDPADSSENASETSQGSSAGTRGGSPADGPDGRPAGSEGRDSFGNQGGDASRSGGSQAGGGNGASGEDAGTDIGGTSGAGGNDDAGAIPGLPGGKLPPSAASGAPTGSPRERQAAVAAAEAALKNAGSGSAESRYRRLLEAYQALAPFVDQDAQCRGLAGRLLSEMERIGGGVAPGRVPDADKPLIAE